MRILVFSERLSFPYDEGIKRVALELVRALRARHQVYALTSSGRTDSTREIQNIDTNRLLLSGELAKAVRRFRPHGVIYVPTAGGTFFSFVRAKVLKSYGRPGPLLMVLLQPRPASGWLRKVIARISPDCAAAASSRLAASLRRMGCPAALLPPAVDNQKFNPASPAEKEGLRREYKLPSNIPIVTHVGHIRAERNLSALADLQRRGNCHVLVAGSTSSRQDESVKTALRRAGATVIDDYLENIEDLYRLSDGYVFPARAENQAIEVPLSVLEAMACNLPVVSTPFGGLPDFFPEGSGFFYWRADEDLSGLVRKAIRTPSQTRSRVESLTWAAAAQALVSLMAMEREP